MGIRPTDAQVALRGVIDAEISVWMHANLARCVIRRGQAWAWLQVEKDNK